MADHATLPLEPSRQAGAKRDILYVDDEPDNGIVFEAEFGGEFTVWCAGSAREAMELVAEHDFPVVVSDHRMPHMTGAELFGLLRREHPYIKQIMLSGFSDCPEVTAAINQGQIYWFQKPWCRNSLYPVLRNAIESHDLLIAKERVECRAAEMRQTERVIEQATAVANAANRSKSEFLANMSHEIRTPLTAIMGFADILLGEVDYVERSEAAKTIKRNGEHLLSIIDEILDLSKIEAGKLRIEKTPTCPVKLLSEVTKLLEVRAASKGLDLSLRFATPLPSAIETDPVRLRQVLINLVGNAIKFTDSGSVQVVARLVHQQPAPRLEIAVLDTGVGLSSDELSRLFQPFSQGDSSAVRKFGGAGLGLAISQRLAQLLGGVIRVESTPGQGSVFTVSIAIGPIGAAPLVDLTATDTRDLHSPPEPTASERRERLNCRVLLAEDGPDNQRLIGFVLEQAGAHVALADNGQIAYELTLGEDSMGRPFDVVLMDMQMPVLDGYTATMRLRDAGYRGSVIALTAHAMSGDRQRCLDAGCDDYLTKPIDRQKLVELVARYAAK